MKASIADDFTSWLPLATSSAEPMLIIVDQLLNRKSRLKNFILRSNILRSVTFLFFNLKWRRVRSSCLLFLFTLVSFFLVAFPDSVEVEFVGYLKDLVKLLLGVLFDFEGDRDFVQVFDFRAEIDLLAIQVVNCLRHVNQKAVFVDPKTLQANVVVAEFVEVLADLLLNVA